MNRVIVIQEIINRKQAKTYLEIGTAKGKCFLNIKARKKISVDTGSYISFFRKLKHTFKSPSNIFNKYYRMTSDEFFKKIPEILNGQKVDVIFVDGLHTHKQTLKDVENALPLLKEDGVMVLHDCNPPFESAAYPADSYEEYAKNLHLPGWTGQWCGDVWKTVPYLRSTRNDLDIFVLDCDWGLGIITKREPKEALEYSPSEIEALTYHDLDNKRVKILNLKSPEYFQDFIQAL